MIKGIGKLISWAWQKLRAFWPWYKGLYRGKRWYTRVCIIIVSCITAFFLYLGAVDINFLWLFGKSPGYLTGILNPPVNEASEIYSADGVLIGKYFNENRTPVKYNEINPAFFRGLIDTEDVRFYHHFGIDPIGIFSAMKDALFHHDGRGASTITQQLAKNMFRVRSQYSTGLVGLIPGLRILVVKSKEWIIATKLETVYSKKEILTMYANTVDFGSNAYGIKTAAKTYFNTTPGDLTTEQAALLVGMLKATSYYNPRTNPKNSIDRRNTVLSNMVEYGDLSKTAFDSISKIPIKLNYKVEENYDGQAKYFREAVAQYLKSWCDDNGYDLYTSGLKIYTTIDTRMQKYAEEAAVKQMRTIQQSFKNQWGDSDPWRDENGQVIPGFIEGIAEKQPIYKYLCQKYHNNLDSVTYYLNKPHPVKLFDYGKGSIVKDLSTMDSIRYMVHFMHCAMVAMEPQTGYVKAWVGDIDFNQWKYDKVTAERQPGSTFKLFVYTEAMNQGLTPCDKRRDEFISMQVYDKKKHMEVTWQPTNSNGVFTGDSMPLKSAFAQSVNSVAVRIGQEMGIKRIIATAQAMGIKSPLDDEPSLALGSSDVNLLELTNAYCVIPNQGKHHDPVLVVKILDHNGKEVYAGPTGEDQVIPYKSSYLMQQMLQGGLTEPGGTSSRLWAYIDKFKDTDFGGKTGTSNNHSDAWFEAVTPNLVVGTWVGGEYRCIHFRTGLLGQGSRTALPICGTFLKAMLSDPHFKKYRAKFPKCQDEDIARSMYTCASYRRPQPVKPAAAKADSLNPATDEEIQLDENGNPISTPNNENASGQNGSNNSTDNNGKNRHRQGEEPVNLNNL
ncbi:transglycosylase domain-containing protein [Prevotella cerevisiae]|uniref:Transglycosylase domain-containing protein n=1 Tax=Segatella cerevisiae TaxID=2053716 RepID=A0ABT1BVP4_9BACT|nr:transglycosylase domain-containing protein [Segatella cerevisiae]MCO6025152.1 transglycosylase domain-containing protein [Segatella cerevisiae]